MSDRAIQVEGLHKSYGDRPVLRGLDLAVGWGEFLVLFGANGVGKTTLLRVLSTQARPEAGTVRVAGYDCRRQAGAVRRQVGVVGHKGLLYEDLTCRENLTFYGRLFGLPDLRQRTDAALSRVGLTARADQRVRTLSHGMQKRLSIARAILHRPAILLLDEPESGLDAESVTMLHDLLREWVDAGRTVVMTTHNLDLGTAWAHRIALLADGKMRSQDVSPGEDGPGPRRLPASQSSESDR